MFNSYDEENSLIKKAYSMNNYACRINDVDNRKCYIYFSSNALYSLNDEKDFEKKIFENDRYEWMNRGPSEKPKKEIFVRDIFLSWYVKGINSQLNNIDSVLEFLKNETAGYDVTTVGVSSGGYMAVIAAEYLSAERCFCNSGQFSLNNHNNHVEENPLLKKNAENNKWYEAYKFIEKTPVYYFYPDGCGHDGVQMQFVKNKKNVYIFKFRSKYHASTVLSVSLLELLSMNNDSLKELAEKYGNGKKSISQFWFSVKMSGFRKTMVFSIKKVKKAIDRKRKKH